MKKLLVFLMIVGLMSFCTSCNSDDNEGLKEVVLTSDIVGGELAVGKTATFKVLYKGVEVTELFELKDKNGKNVKNAKFTPTEKGNYSFIAKKRGYKDSEITIKVIAGTAVESKQMIFVSLFTPEKDIKLNSSLELKIRNEEGEVVEGALLCVNGNKIDGGISNDKGIITVPSLPVIGAFAITVVKDELKSNEVIINVKSPGKIQYKNMEFGLNSAKLTYAVNADGTPALVSLQGEKGFFIGWEITAVGNKVGDDYNNKMNVRFYTIAEYDSKGNPLLSLTPDTEIFYLDSSYTVNGQMLPKELGYQANVVFNKFDFDSKEVDLTVLSTDDIEKGVKLISVFVGTLDDIKGVVK